MKKKKRIQVHVLSLHTPLWTIGNCVSENALILSVPLGPQTHWREFTLCSLEEYISDENFKA